MLRRRRRRGGRRTCTAGCRPAKGHGTALDLAAKNAWFARAAEAGLPGRARSRSVTAVTRITGLGETGSWPTILADLDSLTETEIEPGGARFRLRSAL
jgi:hypothetical protein